MKKERIVLLLMAFAICCGLFVGCGGRPATMGSSSKTSSSSSQAGSIASSRTSSGKESSSKASSGKTSSSQTPSSQAASGTATGKASEISCPLCQGTKTVQCGYCSGTGRDPATGGLCSRCKDKNGRLTCYNCEGHGTILTNDPDYDSTHWDYNLGRDKTRRNAGAGAAGGGTQGNGAPNGMVPCPLCKGGRICPVCGGTKKIYVPDYGTGTGGTYVYCEGCHGSGLCYECGGVGYVLP